MALKVLFLASEPEDRPPVDCARELQSIREDLARHRTDHLFDIEANFNTRPEQLSSLISHYQPHVLHLSMHGNVDGVEFEDQHQRAQVLLGPETMKSIGHICRIVKTVKCAVLAYCSSRSHAPILQEFVPNVIGMPDLVDNEACAVYSPAFYRLLGLGNDLFAAHQGAKNEISKYPHWHLRELPLFFGANSSGQQPLFPTVSPPTQRALEDRRVPPSPGRITIRVSSNPSEIDIHIEPAFPSRPVSDTTGYSGPLPPFRDTNYTWIDEPTSLN